MLFPNFRRDRQRLDDIEINYVTAGKGPPLLLLHGFPQNLAM
jgi:pimeloyl-ACP methyl ester carboxylesterase